MFLPHMWNLLHRTNPDSTRWFAERAVSFTNLVQVADQYELAAINALVPIHAARRTHLLSILE
jgi:hypothetical protein